MKNTIKWLSRHLKQQDIKRKKEQMEWEQYLRGIKPTVYVTEPILLQIRKQFSPEEFRACFLNEDYRDYLENEIKENLCHKAKDYVRVKYESGGMMSGVLELYKPKEDD